MIFRFNLKKKEIDTEAAVSFWKWFQENETRIKGRCLCDVRNLEHEIAGQLRAVFSYFGGSFEVHIGISEGRGELFLFHGGDRHLARDSEKLGELMPADLRSRWRFVVGR